LSLLNYYVSVNDVLTDVEPNPVALVYSSYAVKYNLNLFQAVMSGENYPSDLNLLDLVLVKPRPHYVFIHGDDRQLVVEPDRPEPVTFTGRDDSYFRLPIDGTISSLEFNFQTVEPSGLLLYADNPVTGDVIAVEIYDGESCLLGTFSKALLQIQK
jgi:hypothetical protein